VLYASDSGPVKRAQNSSSGFVTFVNNTIVDRSDIPYSEMIELRRAEVEELAQKYTEALAKPAGSCSVVNIPHHQILLQIDSNRIFVQGQDGAGNIVASREVLSEKPLCFDVFTFSDVSMLQNDPSPRTSKDGNNLVMHFYTGHEISPILPPNTIQFSGSTMLKKLDLSALISDTLPRQWLIFPGKPEAGELRLIDPEVIIVREHSSCMSAYLLPEKSIFHQGKYTIDELRKRGAIFYYQDTEVINCE